MDWRGKLERVMAQAEEELARYRENDTAYRYQRGYVEGLNRAIDAGEAGLANQVRSAEDALTALAEPIPGVRSIDLRLSGQVDALRRADSLRDTGPNGPVG